MSVHVLRYGRVLCGAIHGLPIDWEERQTWVGFNDPAWTRIATCPTCRSAAALLARCSVGVPASALLPGFASLDG